MGLVLTAGLLSGCSHFTLAEQSGSLSVRKQSRVANASCVVLPFRFEPKSSTEAGAMDASDLRRWQQILGTGLDQSSIFAEVIISEDGTIPEEADYLIGGAITSFKFRKNWIPTFFPVHIGLSVISLTLYTWVGWPTTVTDVEFGVNVKLRDANSKKLLGRYREFFGDTSTLNIYTSGTKNPYENPNLVFTNVVDSLASRIAFSLPRPATPND